MELSEGDPWFGSDSADEGSFELKVSP
jgi:hypothetical protein